MDMTLSAAGQEPGRFRGRTVLVTGAGTGIGAAVCRRIAAEEGNVVLTGRREGPLKEVAATLGDGAVGGGPAAGGAPAVVFPGEAPAAGDVRTVLAAAIETFGALDVVIANA